ncbi:MAG: serine hydrolase [Bacteroidota bacterium]
MRNITLLILACSVSIFTGCFQEAQSTDPFFHSELIDTSIKDLIDERVAKGINQSIIIGAIDPSGMDIYANGQLSAQGENKPNAYAMYEIGSITKVFTGLLLADRVTRKELQLTDTLGSLLPNSIALKSPIGTVQLKQLATHSAGFGRQPSNLHTEGYNPTNPYAHCTGQLLQQELYLESGRTEISYNGR